MDDLLEHEDSCNKQLLHCPRLTSSGPTRQLYLTLHTLALPLILQKTGYIGGEEEGIEEEEGREGATTSPCWRVAEAGR